MEQHPQLVPRADKLILYKEIARRICAHQTLLDIARIVNRTLATVRKYMRDPAFSEILQKIDARVWEATMSDLQEQAKESIFTRAENDSPEAYDILHEIMTDKHNKSELRSKLALDVLEMGGMRKRPGEESGEQKIAALSSIHLTILGETIKQVHDRHDVETTATGSSSPPAKH